MPGPLNLGGGGQGGGGGGLGAPLQLPTNMNLGGLVSAAQPPGFTQFLQGMASIPNMVDQSMYDWTQAQSMRAQMQYYQMQTANNQWDQAIQMLQKNNALGSSPAFKDHMTKLAAITGYELPLDSAGNIDPSVYGVNFTELMKDKDFQERWWAATPSQRRAMASTMHLTGVSDQAFNAEPVLTTAESVLQGKLKVSVDSEKRLQMLADSDISLNTAKAQGIRANIAIQKQKVIEARQTLNEKYWEVKYKTDALQRIADKGNLTKLDIANINALQREISSAERDATTAVDDADKTLGTAYDNGVDEGTLTSIVNDRDNFDKQLTSVTSQANSLIQSLPGRINASQGRSVTQQSGAVNATVQSAAPPPPPSGQRFVNPQTGQTIQWVPGQGWVNAPP